MFLAASTDAMGLFLGRCYSNVLSEFKCPFAAADVLVVIHGLSWSRPSFNEVRFTKFLPSDCMFLYGQLHLFTFLHYLLILDGMLHNSANPNN